MLNFINRLKGLLPKRYKGKRVLHDNRFKNFFLRKYNFLNSLIYVFIALGLVGITYFNGLNFKNNKTDNKKEPTKDFNVEQESIRPEIPKDAIAKYDYRSNSVELPRENTHKDNNVEETFKIEEVPENINTLVEIKLLLEKNNLTSEDLINLLYNSRYQDASSNLFTNYPGLDNTKILNLLEGNQIILRDNLYLGDSRTQGMLLSGAVNEQNTVYGVGYGYSWLIGNGNFSSNKTNALNGGINGLETKMEANKPYNIVIWLGVNDYKYVSANTYYQKFVELATSRWSNHNIYIASVGPVHDGRATTVNNNGINNFNASLKELVNNSGISNLTYIDLNLTQGSINRYDNAGLHYGYSDYELICNLMNAGIAENDLKSSNDILAFLYSVLLDYDKTNTNNEVMTGYTLVREK